MSIRPVKKIIESKPTMEGAGVHLRRAFGFGDTKEFDPFLLLDDFRNDRPDDYKAGFPWHPHRGIETITYVLAGEVDHGDSLGNKGALGAGDVQWMTAGSGIMHQEMPKGDAQGRMHGFQLWANLPRVAEDDGAALPGHQGRRHSRGRSTTTAPRCASWSATSGARRARSRASPPIRAISTSACRPASARPSRSRSTATPSPTSSRARARSARRRKPFGVLTEKEVDGQEIEGPRADRQPLAGGVRPRRRGHGAGRRAGHPLPAGVRQADRGAGRLVRADRDEHPGRAAAGGERAARRHVHQEAVNAPRVRRATNSASFPRRERRNPGLAC